jgi:cystathionine beta-lyase
MYFERPIMNFDEIINRVGTHSDKWDSMEKNYGVSPDKGISMWVADMDFRPAARISDSIAKMQDHGIYGYYGDDNSYRQSICWWMENRHDWKVDPSHIFTTHGLVHGTGMCVDAYSQPGDGIILFTPVYHAFARVITAAGRIVTECPLTDIDGRYTMDFDAYEKCLTGKEKMIILCSPHNPGGTVWMRNELQALADFAIKHNLIIVSDEIHHDLVMPSSQKHIAMTLIEGIEDRLVMMTAPTKTFNIAGCHTGNVIIADSKLRKTFGQRMKATGISGNSFGLVMTEAAYSPDGAVWVDSLMEYLATNARIFDRGINSIKGLNSMKLESTYLAWVNFEGTGLSSDKIIDKIQNDAQIAASHGSSFGSGGQTYMRFNIGLPKQRVVEAIDRLQQTFR